MIGYDAKSPMTKKLNIGVSITLASVYASIIIPGVLNPKPDAPPIDFFSLKGVVDMFHTSGDEFILAAWIHYVCYSLYCFIWFIIHSCNHIYIGYI